MVNFEQIVEHQQNQQYAGQIVMIVGGVVGSILTVIFFAASGGVSSEAKITRNALVATAWTMLTVGLILLILIGPLIYNGLIQLPLATTTNTPAETVSPENSNIVGQINGQVEQKNK